MHQSRSYQNGSLWYYAPDKGATIVFAILFAISGIVHLYQTWKYKSWKVTGLLPWSALLFVAGFVMRSIGAFGQWGNVGVYIASTVLLLAAPPVYEVTNYLILGRILYYIPYHSPIHPGRVFTTFLAVSAVIEAITANGAARVAGADSSPTSVTTGKALLKAALLLQIILMVAFVTLAGRFHYNCVKNRVFNRKIKRALIVLYISSTLITARTIYRTVEYFRAASLSPQAQPEDISPVLKGKWYFWVFEAVLMFCNTTLLNAFHPMRSLPLSNKVYLAEDGVSEIEGPGYKDPRPWIMTFIDPFDICGLILRRDRHTKYWESGSADGTVSPCAGAKV
ncbi:Uncharacterized protein PECH_005690 [Penicillium ucsense]|uniref:RTA1 domain protein n=1 Tax=Penicillium ucsense TaxID=2839758 RepID=A0A8J8WAI9_9EURO|nr:Uncharacterized protein PECM_004529 [Penicillium ucsense]KAF7736208.1 Uncharacterized protein PECH_005690 [Penicillium ucsense]